MKGSDLKCPRCGEGAADVAPDFEMDMSGNGTCITTAAVLWTCTNGHRHITGNRGNGVESMSCGDFLAEREEADR